MVYGFRILKKHWTVNVIRIGINIMSKCWELRQRCDEYNEKIMWNSKIHMNIVKKLIEVV